jgi:hypothetical protein
LFKKYRIYGYLPWYSAIMFTLAVISGIILIRIIDNKSLIYVCGRHFTEFVISEIPDTVNAERKISRSALELLRGMGRVQQF